MLKSHMDARENTLIAISRVPANSGHSLHKGTPREAFIGEFLRSHLPGTVEIGTGELIDSSSEPGDSRNQFDIVVHSKAYPKLDFGGGITAFLIESAVATIEVKSTLTKVELAKAIKASVIAKQLKPVYSETFRTGHVPPKVVNLVVAYDGPKSMETVYGWVCEIHEEMKIDSPRLPDNENRLAVPAPSVDGVYILGVGFLYFDNVPTSFATQQLRERNPDLRWVLADGSTGNLLMFFVALHGALSNVSARFVDLAVYLGKFAIAPKFGTY